MPYKIILIMLYYNIYIKHYSMLFEWEAPRQKWQIYGASAPDVVADLYILFMCLFVARCCFPVFDDVCVLSLLLLAMCA